MKILVGELRGKRYFTWLRPALLSRCGPHW